MTEFEKLLKKLDDLTKSANTSCSEFTNIQIVLRLGSALAVHLRSLVSLWK